MALGLVPCQEHDWNPAVLAQPGAPSFVRKCAYAAFERAVEPLHSAI